MRQRPRPTDRFSRAVQLADDEARVLAAPVLGSEHLLLGLIGEERESGGCLLVGVAPDDLRALLPRAHRTSGAPTLSRRAVGALDAARRLADSRGERAVGAEHLLAAVLGDPDCAAVAALERLGVDVGDLWSGAVAALERPRPVASLR
jgi:ATP-dependent Clp protease ATP-binding subunit ClpC